MPRADKAFSERVETHCNQLNIQTNADAIEMLVDYAEELIRWNRRINLTGAKTVGQFIDGPLFDALTLVPVYAEKPSLVDIGSGGGLPGIPLMILKAPPEVTLVEPRSKRATFLRHIIAKLGLCLHVEESRIEALSPRKWAAGVAQAVFEPSMWIRFATQYVAPHGYIYVLSSSALEGIPSGIEIDATAERQSPQNARRYSYRLIVHMK